MALWEAMLDGRQRQVTTPEASYEQPDVDASGALSADARADALRHPGDTRSTWSPLPLRTAGH